MNKNSKSMPIYNLGVLVEECQRVSVRDCVNATGEKLKEALLQSKVNINNLSVSLKTSKTGFGGKRIWFSCPLCQRRVGVLFVHPINQAIGCRNCLGLKYRKQRFKNMIENDIGR